MSRFNDRFKSAPWLKDAENIKILVGGTGGIGSNTLYCLTKTIPAQYFIIDDDVVEEYNVYTQFFKKEDVGLPKVTACFNSIKSYTDTQVSAFKRRITDTDTMPIVISAFDNMAARKQLFNAWKSREDRELYIDGRLRATLYEVYIVQKGDEERYEATLFDDSATSDGDCTFKQTTHFGMLIGARITQMLCNYLSNKQNPDSFVVPFKVEELGDLVFFKMEE